MDQGFVIAILVPGTELQMAVQKEPDVIFESGEDNMLVTGVAREDDFIGIDVVFGSGGDAFRLEHSDRQKTNNDNAKQTQGAGGCQLFAEEKGAPQGDCNVHESE